MAKSDVKQKQKANFSAASFKITEYSHFCYKNTSYICWILCRNHVSRLPAV